MKSSDIRDQPLSSLVGDFLVCESCGVVDLDQDRIEVGHPCSRCGVAGDGGMSYYDVSVLSLIDLVQEMFHAASGSGSDPVDDRSARGHYLAVAIFFCALGEVALAHCLRELMFARHLPRTVIDRLLDDHPYARGRTEKVFSSVTGQRWTECICELSKGADLDYKATVTFYLDMAERRNRILHRGQVWNVSRECATECVDQIWPLLNLFVGIHNRFVPELYADRSSNT